MSQGVHDGRTRNSRNTQSFVGICSAVSACSALIVVVATAQSAKPRARDLGIAPGIYATGALNAITDVEGVRVGHTTIVEGDRVRTGVTAIVPHGGNLFQDKVAGAVVGETNDGGLNDIRGLHVTREHVFDAIRTAKSGPVTEGSVGAGTGTVCYGWKGGIGTSSRTLALRQAQGEREYTVGVLAQTNFGGNLTIGGVPIFRSLQPPSRRAASARRTSETNGDGSCMLVVATDAPLDARDLHRLAARAVFGLARTGSSYSNGSGDFAIAFSTSPEVRSRFNETSARAHVILPTEATSPLFEAALEATEEAVYNSLFQATTVRSANGSAEAIPVDRVRELLKR
jgi:D-aminopeptidase